MIELAFEADEATVKNDLEAAPEEAAAAALEHTYFIVPTRLRIDEIELLAYPGVHAAWRPLPLLGFAPRLRQVVATIEDGKSERITLEDGGLLEIFRQEEILRLTSSLDLEGAATVPRDALLQESTRFAAEACAFVAAIAPAMTDHPAWPTWCLSSE